MTPSWAFYMTLLLFIMIPTTILLVGAILLRIKPKRAKTVGAVLAVIGGVELALSFSVTRAFISFVFIYLLTLLLGVGSFVYASRVHKN